MMGAGGIGALKKQPRISYSLRRGWAKRSAGIGSIGQWRFPNYAPFIEREWGLRSVL